MYGLVCRFFFFGGGAHLGLSVNEKNRIALIVCYCAKTSQHVNMYVLCNLCNLQTVYITGQQSETSDMCAKHFLEYAIYFIIMN